MKKGLLLSIVASTVIFAGGDIAPVEPAAAAPAADCSDFYGVVGAYYETMSGDTAVSGRNAGELVDNLFGAENSRFDVVATIGVEKTLFGGIGFGAEASAWSSVGSNFGDHHRVDGSAVAGNYEGGTLSQLFLTASFGNTAVKAGRFAIPGSLSPLLRTGTTAGSKDTTFDGILVANTDLADTTVYGVWAYAQHKKSGNDTKFGAPGDETGAFALGFQNKSIANTTITAVGYYGPDLLAVGSDTIAGALNINSKFGDYGVNAQVTYVDSDRAGFDATMTAALQVNATFGAVDAFAIVAYENDGTDPATLAGGTGSLIGDNIDFDFGNEGYAIGAGLGYKIWTGRAFGRVSYMDYEDTTAGNKDDQTRVTVGYAFKVADIGFRAEYQYVNTTYNGPAAPADLATDRVRLQATYSF